MTDTPATDVCSPADQVPEEARAAARNKKVLAKMMTRLSAASKRERAQAAKLVHEVACLDAQRLFQHADQLIAALDHPEAQTRWEVLGALEEIASRSARLLDKALVPTTNSLHDEDSSVVRLAAFRVLSVYGSTSIRRSEKVWPLLDEALRCYHGDSEYPGMLTALATFVEGRAPEALKLEAGALVEPDASHPKAAIARGARRVFSIATGGKTPQRRMPGGMAKSEPEKPAKGVKKPADKKPADKKRPAKTVPAPKKQAVKKIPAKKAPWKKK